MNSKLFHDFIELVRECGRRRIPFKYYTYYNIGIEYPMLVFKDDHDVVYFEDFGEHKKGDPYNFSVSEICSGSWECDEKYFGQSVEVFISDMYEQYKKTCKEMNIAIDKDFAIKFVENVRRNSVKL